MWRFRFIMYLKKRPPSFRDSGQQESTLEFSFKIQTASDTSYMLNTPDSGFITLHFALCPFESETTVL